MSSVPQSVARHVLDRGEGDEPRYSRSGGTSIAKAELTLFDRTTHVQSSYNLWMGMTLTDKKLLNISILQHMAFEQRVIDTVKDDSRVSR